MATSLEHFVNTVRNTPAQGPFTQLYDFLTKSSEHLCKNVQHLDNCLETLDMQQHSLGVLAILLAKFNQQNIADFDTLFVLVQDFVQNCNGEQIRAAPNMFAELSHAVTQNLVEREQPFRGIFILRRALQKLQMFPSQLTSIHTDLCQLCLLANCFWPAIDVLDIDITDINKENNAYTDKQFLSYYYYGGMIYAAVKNWDRSLYCFELALTTPATIVSHIMLESYKKYVLVSLILLGKVRPLPKYKSAVVQRLIVPLSTHYQEFTAAFTANELEAVKKRMTQSREVFSNDKNLGLVKQCMASLYKKNIQRLTKTFLTLSLANIASRVKLSDPAEAEKYVLNMIEDGEIFATINQKDGMVQFHDNPERYNNLHMLNNLDDQIHYCRQLEEKLQEMDTEMATSPQYIIKCQGHGPAAVGDDDGGPGGAQQQQQQQQQQQSTTTTTTRSQAQSSRD